MRELGILYYDLHTFANLDPTLNKVVYASKYVSEPHVQWIMLDVRSNFGGNL